MFEYKYTVLSICGNRDGYFHEQRYDVQWGRELWLAALLVAWDTVDEYGYKYRV